MPSHDWKLSSYDYKLPQSLIAQYPAPKREQSRMLFLERKSGKISNRNFTEIVSLLPESSCLVINNTKVLPARLPGKRQTGGKIEALLIEENNNGDWSAIVRKAGRIKQGERLEFCDGKLLAKAKERLEEGKWLLEFEETERLKERLEDVGLPPLPPYIERRQASDLQNTKDRERYQTCFATELGAIAAPTAGLHFTPEILTEIRNRGIEILEVTLHVGLGTFSSIDQEGNLFASGTLYQGVVWSGVPSSSPTEKEVIIRDRDETRFPPTDLAIFQQDGDVIIYKCVRENTPDAILNR